MLGSREVERWECPKGKARMMLGGCAPGLLGFAEGRVKGTGSGRGGGGGGGPGLGAREGKDDWGGNWKGRRTADGLAGDWESGPRAADRSLCRIPRCPGQGRAARFVVTYL